MFLPLDPDVTGCVLTVKQAFWFLAILIGLPFPIMILVDVDRGRAEGIALAKELEALANVEEEDGVTMPEHLVRYVEQESQH